LFWFKPANGLTNEFRATDANDVTAPNILGTAVTEDWAPKANTGLDGSTDKPNPLG